MGGRGGDWGPFDTGNKEGPTSAVTGKTYVSTGTFHVRPTVIVRRSTDPVSRKDTVTGQPCIKECFSALREGEGYGRVSSDESRPSQET